MARNDKRIDQLKPSTNALKSTDLFAMYSDNRTEKQTLSNVIDYLQATINTSYFTGGTINGATIFTDVISACTSTVYINTLSPCGGAGSTMDFQGSLNVSGNLDVAGNILSGGTDLSVILSNLEFDISAGGTITGTTIYNGDVYFNNNVYITSGATVNDVTVTGDTIVNTLVVNNSSTFNNVTNFTSGVTINNLTVSGASTFNNTTNFNNVTNFTSGVTINNLTVTGATTFTGPISACTEPIYLSTIESCDGGVININDTISTTTISATTYYGDGSNLSGILTSNGGVISGDTTFISGVTINNLTINGSSSFNGPISACTEGIYVNDIYSCDSGVTVNSNLTYIGQANNPVHDGGIGTVFTLDFDNSNIQTITLTGNTTMNNPLNVKNGAIYTVIMKQGSTTGTINSWGSNFKFEFGTAPTLTTNANAVDIMTFISDDVGNLYGLTAFDFQ
jgi:hypothetical protein